MRKVRAHAQNPTATCAIGAARVGAAPMIERLSEVDDEMKRGARQKVGGWLMESDTVHRAVIHS